MIAYLCKKSSVAYNPVAWRNSRVYKVENTCVDRVALKANLCGNYALAVWSFVYRSVCNGAKLRAVLSVKNNTVYSVWEA